MLGESPCWDVGDGSRDAVVCWIDALSGTLWRHNPINGITLRHSLPAPIGSIAPCVGDALVIALKHSFARYDLNTCALEVLGTIDIDHPDVRLNDGKCDPFGNFIAGTMHMNRQPGEPALGGIYRLRPNGRVDRIGDAFGLANGPCFSIDGRTLYVADSPSPSASPPSSSPSSSRERFCPARAFDDDEVVVDTAHKGLGTVELALIGVAIVAVLGLAVGVAVLVLGY